MHKYKASVLLNEWAVGIPAREWNRNFSASWYADRALVVRRAVILCSHGELAAVRLNPLPGEDAPVFILADGPSPYFAPVRYANAEKAVARQRGARVFKLPFSPFACGRWSAGGTDARDCGNLAVEAALRRAPGVAGYGDRPFDFLYPEGYEKLARSLARLVSAPDEDHRVMLEAALAHELLKTS